MNHLLHIYRIVFLFVSTFFLSIEVSSTQQGSSYFFYQQPEYPRDCKEVRDQCSSDITSGVYSIKPDGYPQPFEVYCDNDDSSGGWTVIQRQIDGSLTFQRSWIDYKNGFGFLSNEFWIGNDKLSYLTNQAVYELRIDMTLSNGSSFYVNYKSFRISDEWSDYNIVSAKKFRSNWNCIVSLCPLNMTQDSCTCENLCTDTIGQTDCYTECEEICVPEGCFVTDTSSFIKNGDSFINAQCSQNCTCIDNQLNCNVPYQCSPHATCSTRDGIRKCYCNEGFEGNGENCTSNTFKDCYEAYQAGRRTDGIYTILPTDWPGSPFQVFCNMSFGDGGWTVFQRRIDGMTNFYRNWTEYKQGFGLLNEGNDFWLGNEPLHYLTDQKDYILRIDFVHSSDTPYYNEFNTFKIGNENIKYQMTYSSFKSGNTGYTNTFDNNNGKRFSTHDQDNDGCGNYNYAQRHRGGWWYSDFAYWCNKYCADSNCFRIEYGTNGCHTLGTYTNLNGDYNGGNGENIFYGVYGGNVCNHRYVEMKIRPSN